MGYVLDIGYAREDKAEYNAAGAGAEIGYFLFVL